MSLQKQIDIELQKVFHNPSVDLELGGKGNTIKLSLIDPEVGSWEYRCMYPSTDEYIYEKVIITFLLYIFIVKTILIQDI